jgi:hypothetical protein
MLIRFCVQSIHVARRRVPRLSKAFFIASIERSHNTLNLSLPGGKRMLGESALECAVRELREETGNSFVIFLFFAELCSGLQALDSHLRQTKPIRLEFENSTCSFVLDPFHLGVDPAPKSS